MIFLILDSTIHQNSRKRGMNVSEVLKWLEEESDRLTEESLSSADPHKTVNNSFLEGFNYALANVQGLAQPQLNENQKLLLEDLKNIKESHEDKNMLGLIWVLGQRFTTVYNIKTFTDQEILQVLQTLEQEVM